MLRRFKTSKLLGDGSAGEVRLVRHSGGFKAVKYFYNEDECQDEINAIRLLQKKGLSTERFSIGTAVLLSNLHLVIDYQGPALTKWLKKRNPKVWTGKDLGFTVDDVTNLANQVFEALHHLCKAGLIHGDIRPENICSKDCKRWVLIDFGLVEELKPGSPPYIRSFVGPSGIRAPENQHGYDSVITSKTEVFMAGMTLWQALNGLAFTPGSVRRLFRIGRLKVKPKGLNRIPHLPTSNSDESVSDYEARVDEYAAQYYQQFHEPFFEAFLNGSLAYPEDLPLGMRIRSCLADDPKNRPRAKDLL